MLGFGLLLSIPAPVSALGSAAPTPTPRLIYLPLVFSPPAQQGPPYPPPGSQGIAYVNYYRATANLPAVLENPEWSVGNALHARYSTKNDILVHAEDPGNPWYTAAGNAAAANSNQIGSHLVTASDEWAVATWMQAAFHSVGILDPGLLTIGYGSYREADGGLQMAAGLDILRGRGAPPAQVHLPVRWPDQGMTVPVGTQIGETPDPLTSCPGYAAPAGLPVLALFGGGATPTITAHSFSDSGSLLGHCVLTGYTYVNPDPALQQLGRAILEARGAVVLIPRQPLVNGRTYTVSLTAGDVPVTWSFRTDFASALGTVIASESLPLPFLPPPPLPRAP